MVLECNGVYTYNSLYPYTGAPLSLRQQCMIKIRGLFVSDVIDKLPLPKEMKKEIKTIPQLYCEYQHVDRDNTYNSCSSDLEMDPLARSIALIAKGNTCRVGLTNTACANVNKLDNTYPHMNSSTETAKTDHEVTAEIISQIPHSRNKVEIEKEIKVY